MYQIPVIAIYDVGKTNKKFFLFDRQYQIVFQKTLVFPQKKDADGYECEDLAMVRDFLFRTLDEVFLSRQFLVKGINFSTYGASLVHVDQDGEPVADMLNYLKPYPAEVLEDFLQLVAAKKSFELETSCPLQGNLNTGLQLFLLKKQRWNLWDKIAYSLHFPQYLSSLLTHSYRSEITTIGCHTCLWDFKNRNWHEWTIRFGIKSKLPEIDTAQNLYNITYNQAKLAVGTGMHDSSAALVPYLKCIKVPFILLSTGTWSVALNPFDKEPLTERQLRQGCLSYLTYQGQPVKSSKFFLGDIYRQEVERIARFFNTRVEKYNSLMFDRHFFWASFAMESLPVMYSDVLPDIAGFSGKDLTRYDSDMDAYYTLVVELLKMQYYYIAIIDAKNEIQDLYVDGGFSKNEVFMQSMAFVFKNHRIYAAKVSQSTALGAAMVLQDNCKDKPVQPPELIETKRYFPG